MRTIKFLLPAILLTGCSMGGYAPSGQHTTQNHGAYGQGQAAHAPNCNYMKCAPAGTYSVAPNRGQHHQAQGYAAQGYGAPQTPSAHAYGTQAGPRHGGGAYGAGHPRGPQGIPALRRGYTYGSLGGILYDVDSEMAGIQGRLGYQSANFWGAELEGSVGLTDESETVAGTTVTGKIDHSVAGFGLARLPISEKFSVHSRVGYHATKISGEIDDGVTVVEASDTDSGLAYGAGVEYKFSPRNAVRLDYTRYDLDGGGADSLALGFARRF